MKSQLLYRQLEEVFVAQIISADRFHKIYWLHLKNIADRVGGVEEVGVEAEEHLVLAEKAAFSQLAQVVVIRIKHLNAAFPYQKYLFEFAARRYYHAALWQYFAFNQGYQAGNHSVRKVIEYRAIWKLYLKEHRKVTNLALNQVRHQIILEAWIEFFIKLTILYLLVSKLKAQVHDLFPVLHVFYQ